MKLAIIGSRGFNNWDLFLNSIRKYYGPMDTQTKKTDWVFSEIISGGATGADSFGKELAERSLVKYTEFLPDWEKYGKAAGFKRNELIINAAEEVIAFWDGASRGTANSLSIAKRQKKPTVIVYF